MTLLQTVRNLHDQAFALITKLTNTWLLGLLARFTFLAVLYFYFLNSFATKVGEGLFGFFSVQASAYYQIAPFAVDAASGDVDAIHFLPWGFIVTLGTYTEFLLPLLIVAGLFTRIASAGMIGFIAVQTIVDITVHKVGPETIGALFDRFPDGMILDQRMLWLFPLIYLVLKGAGTLSLDHVLGRVFVNKTASENMALDMQTAS